MTDSLLPPRSSGTNKLVIFLLVGGALMLAAALALFLRRGGAPSAEPPPLPPAPIAAPTPLVEPAIDRPSLQQVDTGTAPVADPVKPERGGRVERTGTIDEAAVKSFLRTHEGQVKSCYERRLKNNPLLEGKLDLNIVVQSSGKVGAITRNDNSLRDEELFECVKRTIRTWQFPRPEGGQVVIAKTFSFKKK